GEVRKAAVVTRLAGDEADEYQRLQGLCGFAAVKVLPRGDFSKQAAMSHAVIDHDASPGVFLLLRGSVGQVAGKCRLERWVR
nr:hypothetical protein [Tanacetum cinerariifolium]